MAREQCLDRKDHARGAKPALERAVIEKGALDRMQRAALGQPLDRRHILAVKLEGKGGAGGNRNSVGQYRAGAAHRLVAADLAAGKLQILAQQIDGDPVRHHAEPVGATIDRHHNGDRHAHPSALRWRRNNTAIMRRR